MATDPNALKQDAIMRALIQALQTGTGEKFLEQMLPKHMGRTFSPPTVEEREFLVDRMAAMLDQAIAVREGEMVLSRKPDVHDRRMRGY